MSTQLLKQPADSSKLVWSEESKCWTCNLCQKSFRSRGAHNKHARRDCENAQPENPCWKLGWDRRTMSCRYCKQTFVHRRGIRRHLQSKNCPSLPDWGRLFGYSHRTEESQSARQNQGRGQGRGWRVHSNKGRAKGIGQQRHTPGALPGTEYKEEDCDDSDEEEDDEEEESLPLFPGENRYLADGGPQEERPREGPHQGLSGGWPSDLCCQSRTSGDRPHLYSPRQKPDHMQVGRSDRHSKQYLGHGFQGQSADQSGTKEWPDSDMFNSQKTLFSSRSAQSSSRDLERCLKGSLDNPPKNWPSDRSFHSTHTNAAQTWTGNQRARTSQKWPEQEFHHSLKDHPEKQYHQNSSFDGRYISTGHVSRREHNTEPIHRSSRERRGRSTHAKRFGERLSSRDRFDTLQIKFPIDRYPDEERRKNSDFDGSHEGRFISDRHGSQRVSRHSRDMSPPRTENRGTYHKSPERMERQDYSFNCESPPESRHDSYKNSERMERYGSYRESPERVERLGFYKGFERTEKHGCYRESPERLERLGSYRKSRDRLEGHSSFHGTPDRLERHGSHHNKYRQRSHSPIRHREIENELDRRSEYSERRNQDLYRNGKRSPTSYRHQENSRLLDPDIHQERMLRCNSVERYQERLLPDVCDSVEREASPVRDDPFWMASLESRNSPGGKLSPEGHFRFGLGITRHSPCQEGRALRDCPRRRSHSPRHRETEYRQNSRSRYSEAEIHDSTLREKEREEHHQRDYSLRRCSRSPIRRETESRQHRSRHSETGMLESSRRLGSLPQDSSLSRAQHHSPKRFSRSPHRRRETESRRHRSRHSETGMLVSSRRLGSLLQDSRSPHHFSGRFSHSPDRCGETESRQRGRSRHSETRMLESSRRLGSLPQDNNLSRAWHHSPRRFNRSPVRLGKTENRRHRSRHSETEMLESSRRLGSLPQDSRSRHHFSKRFSCSPDRLGDTESRRHSKSRHSETEVLESSRRLGSLPQDSRAWHHSPRTSRRRSRSPDRRETESRRHSKSRHSETGVLESSRRLGSLPQDSRAWHHSPRTSRRLSRSPDRRETESRQLSRPRHSETGMLESSRRLGSLPQDGKIWYHSPRRLSRSPHRLRETQQDSRSQYLETGSGNSSRRRHDSRQGRDQRGLSPRRRSRSPVRRRESGGHRDSGSRHAERGTQDSYRTNQSRERRPVPGEPSRHRTHQEDKRQEPREHGRSRDAGYSGHQRDRERGRHQRYL